MKTLKLVNTIAFLAMIAVNALANLIPLGGKTTGQISEMYPSLFTPAPYTFTIWGLIYLWLAIFIIYQWEAFDNGIHSSDIREIVGLWFAISCVFNIAWIVCWHMNAIGLSMIAMLGLLLSLIVIETKLSSLDEFLFQHLLFKPAFQIYLGWIIAASISNLSIFLAKIGWIIPGTMGSIWTILMLITGAFVASAVIWLFHNRFAGIAIIWAYIGIIVRHASDKGYAMRYPWILTFAIICTILMTGLVIAGTLKDSYESKPEVRYSAITVPKGSDKNDG